MKHPHLFAILTVVAAAALAAGAPQKDRNAEKNGVITEKDVPYLGPERKEKMDLYLPAKDGGGPRPAILIVHGGGWTGGSKSAKREAQMGEVFAGAGFVAASIDYKLATKTAGSWPQCIHDCKTALRFLRKNAEKYHLDPRRIGAIGGSAGGHLVLLLAYTGNNPKLDPAGPDGEFPTDVQAVVDLYGIPDVSRMHKDQATPWGTSMLREAASDPAMLEAASPVSYLTKDSPPTLVMHGTKDATVPIEASEDFVKILQERGARHRYIRVEGAPHTFLIDSNYGDFRKTIVDFFNESMK